MRIQGKVLKQIIKEELSRLVVKEANDLAAAISAGRARGAVSKISSTDDMTAFFDDVLAGKKIVTANRNTPGENLYVNQALGVFEKLSNLPTGDLTSFPTSTYPATGIVKLQKMCSLQADGDFGRQTLAAAVTGGKARLDPTVMSSPEQRSRAAKLIALVASSKDIPDNPDKVAAVLAGADVSSNGKAAGIVLAGPKRAAPPDEKLITPDQILAAALDLHVMPMIASAAGMTEEDVENKLQTFVGSSMWMPSMTLSEWIKFISDNRVSTVNPDQEREIANAIAAVHAEPDVSQAGSAYRPASGSTADATMNESRDIASRLMERWLK